ncbi:MAG TPA: lipid-binding SYLF domain-containing protein [Pirellulales bacterium]|nr:lipid-binding SYLF domain-containing protein [Pirellulales bacterium]
MLRVHLFAVLLTVGVFVPDAFANRGPERTVELATQVLHDIMTIPIRQIPENLLSEAQGIAIVPGVIKVGFVGGIRRGRGVVMVRDREGDWGLPQFVILTGGSVGWQAGVQATDVILVFRTSQSIEGLLNGTCTLGVGASLAAGPVGRSAEAATDPRLQAEVLSYSRGRGVFAGVAIDGSAIEIDGQSHQLFYGSPPNLLPAAVPESAVRLLAEVTSLTGGKDVPIQLPLPGVGAAGVQVPTQADGLRVELSQHAARLYALLDDRWRQYLALPSEVFSGTSPPRLDSLKAALQQFDRVAADAKFRGLSERTEFQFVHDDLRNYIDLWAKQTPLDLPPPPVEQKVKK